MRLLVASIVSLTFATSAFAGPSNVLTLSPGQDVSNRVELLVMGDDNRLDLSQTSSGSVHGENLITLTVRGDRNGASRGASTKTLIADLPWGTLSQTGHSNSMDLSVSGSDNLLAAVQRGSSNVLQGSISGNANWAAVSQTGQNNLASFSQTGNGNMVSISQTSW